jgi:hypothetical protein
VIALLDTSHKLDDCETELGVQCGQLFTPATGFKAQRIDDVFGIDNGSYSGFKEKPFLNLLKKHGDRKDLCRFVAIPDVIDPINRIGNARRTLEVFERWFHRPELKGWKLAFVCQDGQENLPIPWDEVEAVFIGGSTQWKESTHAVSCILAAKALGKWVHVGRVNTPARWEMCERLGVDSVDGTGIGLKTYMRIAIRERNNNTTRLFPLESMMQPSVEKD